MQFWCGENGSLSFSNIGTQLRLIVRSVRNVLTGGTKQRYRKVDFKRKVRVAVL